MTKGIFITGSGTGVGKTYVSALLLREFSAMGYRTTYMKPVETGCGGSPDAGGDTDYALGFASCKADINLHSPYRFEPACSPHLAARMEGCVVDIDNIVSAYGNLIGKTSADIVIVEGAGGILVPVNDNNEYMADVIKALAIPSIPVVDPGLGTLNHTFLSLRALDQYGIPVIGVIINNARNIGRDFIYEDNVKKISRHIDTVPCLNVDYNSAPDEHRGRRGGSLPPAGSAAEQLTGFCHEIISRL